MKRKPKKKARKAGAGVKRIYVLEVTIIGGPVAEEFMKENQTISRTIEIRGDQTLARLHDAIFDAFDRDDEHMYEFQLGKGPHDPEGKHYVLPMAMHDSFGLGPEPAGDVTRTAIGSLGLEPGSAFGYWFDFGDDWWHQVDVVSIEEKAPKGKYPKVTKRVGKSPPQYIDWEEEEDLDGEED